MKIFSIGSHGYIARKVLEVLQTRQATAIRVSSRPDNGELHLNLSQPELFRYDEIQPKDVILMTAAVSSPDICREQHELAWAVNVTGATDFLARCLDRGARAIFFSSDTVYGESQGAVDEKTLCNPAGEYAVMKHEVEKRFVENSSFKSIRLSYVFSNEDKFTKYLIGCSSRDEEAELFHPFYRAIVHRDDVVEGALALAKRWEEFPQQIINFGGPELLSRIDFAECLKRVALPNLRFRVTEPSDEFFKNRPRVIAMTSNILPRLLGRACHSLAEAAQIEFASKY